MYLTGGGLVTHFRKRGGERERWTQRGTERERKEKERESE